MSLYRTNRRSRLAVIFISIGIMAGLACYLWQDRYYLRFLPVPMGALSILYDHGTVLPITTPQRPGGDFVPSHHDLTSESGLRQALDDIQKLSPTTGSNVSYPVPLSFDGWLNYVRTEPFLCTDGTQLFLLTAWSQGLVAREWQLLPREWQPGGGHSVAEFYNPRAQRWILVDGQHAAVIRDASGEPLDMAAVLRFWREGRPDEIHVDYGPFADFMRNHGRGPTTEEYFFDAGLLNQAVLSLREPTWFAQAERNDLVIGYAVFGGGNAHDSRVLLTKAAAIALLIATAVFFRFAAASFRQRRS